MPGWSPPGLCNNESNAVFIIINQLANHVTETGIHCVQLLPTLLELFILLFADGIVLFVNYTRGVISSGEFVERML